jgi:hypothetical protein
MHPAARNPGLSALVTLVACAVALLGPGCGGAKLTSQQTIERFSQELREAVSANVADEGRKTQMLLVVDQLEALHIRFSQETAEFVDSYRKLNAEYDATRPAFDQLFSDYNAKRIKARDQALDLHFQLASLASRGQGAATASEWDAIGKAEVKLYEEANAARSADGNTK